MFKMKKLRGWLIILLGIVLILPLLGVSALGTVSEGILAWVLAIVVLALGIQSVIKN